MKKAFAAVIVLLLTVTALHAQTSWVNFKVDDRVSVKFPSQPKELAPGSVMSVSKDSSMVYIVTMVSFKNFGLDSATLAPIKDTPEFADQLKAGLSQSMAKVTLQDFKLGTWNGFTSYTTTGTDEQKKQYDMQMLIIGDKLYSISAVAKTAAPNKDKDSFFKGINLTK